MKIDEPRRKKQVGGVDGRGSDGGAGLDDAPVRHVKIALLNCPIRQAEPGIEKAHAHA
jgi:hypothetical protein